jgi:hypothetical protein
MFLTRVGCSGCHREFGDGSHGTAAKGGAVAAKEVACISCHGPAYDGMVGRWQKAFGPAADAVAAEVAAALAAAEKAGDAGAGVRSALEDARHDAALVVNDKSRGVHNPWFARKLLDSAFDASQSAWSKLDPARPRAASPLAPPFATKETCALVCHVGIEERKIGVAGTRFDHSAHVMKSGRDCDSCHSTTEHGKVLAAAKDCATCHHAPETAKARDCATCHRDEDAFLRGVAGDGEQGPQMMAKVSCRECHGDMAQPPAGGSVRALVQANCNVCHKEKYAATVAEWTSDSDEWFAEADARLAKIRARVAAGKTTQAKADAAAAIVAHLRRAKPAHNVLSFEEAKEAFDAAASDAEK